MSVQINGSDGRIISTHADHSGNVSIGGTLTYEDVTNIDSVGLVTARSGIEIGARPGVAASISVDGNMIVSGISTFGGDVQVPDKIIHSGDTNTAIRFPEADTVTVETGGSERFRVSSDGNVGVGVLSPDVELDINGDSSSNTQIRIRKATAGNYGVIKLDRDASGTAGGQLGIAGASSHFVTTASQHDIVLRSEANLLFGVGGSNERLRVDSSGRVIITNDSVTNPSGTNTQYAPLVVRGNTSATSSRSAFINFARSEASANISADEGIGEIYFGDQQAGEYGAIKCFADAAAAVGDYPGRLSFWTTADGASSLTERLRIDSSGRVLIGTGSDSAGVGVSPVLQVEDVTGSPYGGVSFSYNAADTVGPRLYLTKSRGTANGATTIVQDDDQLGAIFFTGADGNDRASRGASIQCHVDGSPGSNDMPGRLTFRTTADGASTSAERVRITSDGKFGILGNGANTTIVSNEYTWPYAPFHVRYNSNSSASNNGTYCAYFDNLVGTPGSAGDIQQQKTWIGMAFHDSNSNNRPQVKFGAEVGQRGNADSQPKEGSGNFVVYTTTGNSNYDDSSTEKFVVQYNGTATISGSTVTSDVRLKTDITTLTGALDKVKQLRGVEYLWNDVAIENRGMSNREDGEKQIGVIADEVKPIYPALVDDSGLRGKDGTLYKQVAYERLVPILLEAIKELAAKVEALEG